jgi:hypothetical protein
MRHVFSGKGRSKFRSTIVDALREQDKSLTEGRQLVIQFEEEKKGYTGSYECKIDASACAFTVDFKNTDPTRFPARIKAAARALCQEGYDGIYEISHKAGELTIRKK